MDGKKKIVCAHVFFPKILSLYRDFGDICWVFLDSTSLEKWQNNKSKSNRPNNPIEMNELKPPWPPWTSGNCRKQDISLTAGHILHNPTESTFGPGHFTYFTCYISLGGETQWPWNWHGTAPSSFPGRIKERAHPLPRATTSSECICQRHCTAHSSALYK